MMAFKPATIASRNHDVGSKPRGTFTTSLIAPNAANPKHAYWHRPPNRSQLRISAVTSSRSLNGLFSSMRGMGIASFAFSALHRERVKG